MYEEQLGAYSDDPAAVSHHCAVRSVIRPRPFGASAYPGARLLRAGGMTAALNGAFALESGPLSW